MTWRYFTRISCSAALAAVIREVKPGIVLTHSPQDYMEDHMTTSRLAVTAAFTRGMPNFRTVPKRAAANYVTMVYHAMPHGLRDQFADASSRAHSSIRRQSTARNSRRWPRKQPAGLAAYQPGHEFLAAGDGGPVPGSRTDVRTFQTCGRLAAAFPPGLRQEDADPLREALGKNVFLNKAYEKNLQHGLITALR